MLAFDETGKLKVSTVRQIFRHEADEYLIIRTNHRQVSVTPEHPFRSGAGGFKGAGDLRVGDVIHVRGKEGLVTEAITEILRIGETVTVCNLHTDAPHTYFAAGIAVHNKGGGGGGGGGGSGGPATVDDIWISVVMLVVYCVVGIIADPNSPSGGGNLDVIIGRRQVKKKRGKTMKLLEFIAKVDEDWQPKKLEDHARKMFIKLQDHWQARDYDPLKGLIEPRIFRDHTRQLEGLKRNHEINVIDDLKIKHVDLVHVHYTHEPEDREYTALITVSAINYYVEDRTRKFIRGDKTPLDHQEFWTFRWDGERWLLLEIEQSSASDILTDDNLFEQFTDEGVKQVYGDEADAVAKAGPWLEKEAEVKGKKVERLLAFLVQTDKIWDRREMLGLAREVFLQVMLDREKGELSPDTLDNLHSGIAWHLREQMLHTEIEYRNLSVRKVELTLVRNFHEPEKDEYTVRIRAHAQVIVKRGRKIIQKQPDVTPWEEYWAFGRDGDRWKLKEIFPDEQGNALWDQENFDEDTTQQMLDWYYSKSRAI